MMDISEDTEEERELLVEMARIAMEEIDSGKVRTYTFAEIKKELGWD